MGEFRGDRKMNENIKKLVQLIQENLSLPVKVKIDNRINVEDFAWSVGEIGNPMICEYYNNDGRIYLDDEILDYFEDYVYFDFPDGDEYKETEVMSLIDKLYQEAVDNGEIKKAIFVDIIT